MMVGTDDTRELWRPAFFHLPSRQMCALNKYKLLKSFTLQRREFAYQVGSDTVGLLSKMYDTDSLIFTPDWGQLNI